MKQDMKKTVSWTAENGLCSSCGICKSCCPVNAISYIRLKGRFHPQIDRERCVRCGSCLAVCPGAEMLLPKGETALESVYGTIRASYNAWSRDPVLRHVSSSGGVVSTIAASLLKAGEYDVCFCVDQYRYDRQLKTVPVTKELLPESWADSNLPKSRYLPVSHENAVAYIRQHPEKKVILIGNSCALQGFRKFFARFSLDQDRFLLIGLFCDKVFNYNIYQYYQNAFSQGKELSALHFKNKESGGWPGNMKLIYADGSAEYLDKSERGKVKEYFMPERCLYCVDKLNVCADISVGDNYTGQNSSPLGSNTVLIRTEKGEKAWTLSSGNLEYDSVEPELLRKAQYLDGRLNQVHFAVLKQREINRKTGASAVLNRGIACPGNSADYEKALKYSLDKLRAGECYCELPEQLERQTKIAERRNNPKNPATMAERVLYGIKRRMQSS